MSDALKMARLDILSMKVYLKNYLIILVYPVIFSWWSPSSLAIITSLMFAVMAASVFSVQEKNKLERLYGVFHISRRAVVGGRYLFIALNLLVSMALVLPFYVVINRIHGTAIAMDELLFSYGIGFFFFWLVSGVQVPMFFRLGYTRARLWAYLPFMLIALVPVAISVFPNWRENGAIKTLVRVMEGGLSNPAAFLVAGVAGGLVLLMISMLISLWGYRTRQT